MLWLNLLIAFYPQSEMQMCTFSMLINARKSLLFKEMKMETVEILIFQSLYQLLTVFNKWAALVLPGHLLRCTLSCFLWGNLEIIAQVWYQQLVCSAVWDILNHMVRRVMCFKLLFYFLAFNVMTNFIWFFFLKKLIYFLQYVWS